MKMAKQAGSAMKMKKAEPMKFNAGLRKASAEGKLDNNPKFKAAVDNAPKKLKKTPMQMKKAAMKLKDEAMKLNEKSAMMMKKAAMKLKKEDDAAMKLMDTKLKDVPAKAKKVAKKVVNRVKNATISDVTLGPAGNAIRKKIGKKIKQYKTNKKIDAAIEEMKKYPNIFRDQGDLDDAAKRAKKRAAAMKMGHKSPKKMGHKKK